MTAIDGFVLSRVRQSTARTDRALLVIAGLFGVIALASFPAATVLNEVLARRARRWADPWVDQIFGDVFAVLILALALVVVARARRNAVGWLLLGLIMLGGVSDLCGDIGLVQLHVPADRSLSAGWWGGLDEALDRPILGMVLAILLLFPTGRVPSPRWRPLPWAMAALFPLWFVAHLLSPNDPQEPPFRGVPDPIAVRWFGDPVVQHAFLPAAGAVAVLVFTSLVIRFRAAEADERQQLKWLALLCAGLPLGIVALGFAALIGGNAMEVVGDVIWIFPQIGLPLAITISVTRFRLYDLDLVVNRTAVYGVLCAVLAATYAVVVLITPLVIAGTGHTSPVVVATATLAAAVLAMPARRHIQHLVDRLFGRRAWDARRLIAGFTERWREAPQPSEALRGVLGAALRDPDAQLGFWLREPQCYVDTAGRPLPAAGPGRSTLDIEVAGEPVARILHDSSLERDRRLLRTVASSAALVTENARLQAELLAQVGELEASRARIVAAADAERRRIERDLHDGAQQRLVGLAMRTRLAARAAPDSRALEEIVFELQTATRELRELARGIHPAALAEGLDAAVGSFAARSLVPVTVHLPATRMPDHVERTAYFVIAEAVTNAVRHAEATQIRVSGVIEGETLKVAVVDDGRGGADPRRGSGIVGLCDRAAAAGGQLDLVSPLEVGTTLTISLPCGS